MVPAVCFSKSARIRLGWLLSIVFISTLFLSGAANGQTRPAEGTAQILSAEGLVPAGQAGRTENTVPNPYEDAIGNLYRVDDAAKRNQEHINGGVARILEGEYAPLVFQAAEQGQGGEIQKAANNILNSGFAEVNGTYRGMHQWFKDDVVGNLFQNIGQLAGKWLTEFIDGWISDTVQFLSRVLRIFVLNPNIAVNGLDGNADDGISKYVRQGADIMYGIAVDLLLLLFILCIWKFWAEASWNGGGNLMSPVGRLIATAGLLLAWPTIYAFTIQISNEMIKAICFNSPEELAMLDYTLAQAVKGGLVAIGAGATMVLAPVATNLAFPVAGQFIGPVFYFASSLVFTILGGILIAEIVYLIVLKAIQTALLTAQYMFAPIFLVFFATPDTESYATGYVRAFVETSLWTFVWVGLLKIMTIVMYSNFNPWGKILIAIGVLQLMIQVPTFLGRAQISPVSDFVSAGLVFGTFSKAVNGLKDMGMQAAGAWAGWFTDGRYSDKGLNQTKSVSMNGLAGQTSNSQRLNALNAASDNERLGDEKNVENLVNQGPALKQGDTAGVEKIGVGNTSLDENGKKVKVPPGKDKAGEVNGFFFGQGPEKKGNGSFGGIGKSSGQVAGLNSKNGFSLSNGDASGWDTEKLLHVDTRKLLAKITSCDGKGIRTGQSGASVMGSVANGVSRLNFAEGASESELAHGIYAAAYADRVSSDDAARDAARVSAEQSTLRQPKGVLENMAANWLSNTGGSWNRTAIAKQRFQQAMFEEAVKGSQAYVSQQKGNAYTQYLRDMYGDWSDDNDAMAVHLISNPQSSESPWNRNIGPATESLVASGIPIGADTRGAAQNPTIQSMHPARRKQAIFAALTYTYQEAKAKYGDADSSVFSLAHGEMAKALSAEEVDQSLVMYQLTGQSDLNSPMSSQYLQASSALAFNAQTDFATAYQCLRTASPYVAQRLGYIGKETDPGNISTLSSLGAAISSHCGSEQAPSIMEYVLDYASSTLGSLQAHKIPMTIVQKNDLATPVFEFLEKHVEDGNYGSFSAHTALNAVSKNLQCQGVPFNGATLEAIFAYASNGGKVNRMDSEHIVLSVRALNEAGLDFVTPSIINKAAAQGLALKNGPISWPDFLSP